MVKSALVFLLLFVTTVHAYVVVLSPEVNSSRDPNCEQGLAFKKTIRGLRKNLEFDPTQTAAQTMDRGEYLVEALSSVEQVRSVYAAVFKARKMSAEQASQTLASFAAEDAARAELSPGVNGIDNTIYFVWKTPEDKVLSVIRATLLKKGDPRQLPHLKDFAADKNRVELERAYNAQGPFSWIPAGEVMMVMATYFKDHFGANDYQIGLLTDRPRANLYHRDYGFSVQERIEPDPMVRFLCHYRGADFYDRYLGHVNRAYALAFSAPYGEGMEPALNLLGEVEQRTGMHNYIPNIVAQSVILAAFRHYPEAVAILQHLKFVTPGPANINEDFIALWENRVLYDSLHETGDGAEALSRLDAYLGQNPLQLRVYNDRAALFLIYKLKVLMSMKRWSEARSLILNNSSLLLDAIRNGRNISIWHTDLIESSVRSATAVSLVNRGSRFFIEIMLDVSTSRDPFSSAALVPEVWELLAKSLPQNEQKLAADYLETADFLREFDLNWRVASQSPQASASRANPPR